MSASVRRLALNLSPWVWAYLLFMAAMGLLIDVLWLGTPRIGAVPLMVGLFLNLSAVHSAQKVALWRTLPVSQRQIDLARWQQGAAFPILLFTLMMFVPALLLALAGKLRVAWPFIALMTAAQCGGGILLFGLSVALPAVRDRIGRGSAIPGFLLIFAIVYAPRLFRDSSLEGALEGLAGLGLLIAILLYILAGRWPLPLPVTGWASFWSTPPSENHPSKQAASPGLAGWPALVVAQAPALLLGWCLIPALPLLMRWTLGLAHMDMSFVAASGLLIGALLPTAALATALRALRALPLNAPALTMRLMAPLVAIQIVGAAIYAVTMAWLQPDYPLATGFALLPVAMPALIFALTLRFGPRIAQFSAAIAISLIALGNVFLLYSGFTITQTALLVMVLTGLGFLATLREIVSGRHAYRAQPLVPLSWRGR